VTIDHEALRSNLARSGPPLFFPDPPAPVTFNFDQGIAAEETFPVGELKELMGRVLDSDGERALEYISFEYDHGSDQIVYIASYIELVLGYTGLREQVARWIARTQGTSDLVADGIILTSGSVQGIALAINAFLDPGDGALVESATFPYAMRFMEMAGATIRPVEIDREGIRIDALEARLRELQSAGVRPKLLYVIPTFQLPTGAVLPEDRRRALLEVAERWNLVVLEDAIYQELRFEGERVPSLLSLDRSGLVVQAHGFSKILAPALRLGWISGQPNMIEALASVRQDLGVSQWLCRMMAIYLAEDRLDAHIERANSVYRRKRDVAATMVRECCGDAVQFEVPQGGFYLWIKLADDVDWEKAQHAAAMGGVFCRPGERFMVGEQGQQYLRLAFSHAPDHELQRGIRVLGEAIRGARS
jgi:2-aminoadipate transaminase